MRVLITGGAGFIGSHLADRLLREEFQVRILDSLDSRVHPGGRPEYLASAAEFMHGDVTERNTLLAALQNVDIVFHQAAYQDYMPDYSRFLYVNAFSTALIYELIVEQKLPVRKIVVASSQSVYGEGQYLCSDHGHFLPVPRSREQLSRGQWDVRCPECDRLGEPLFLKEEHTNPFNQYAVSKLAEEKIALGLGWLKGIPTVALRYSITQGPRQSLFNQYSGICRIFVGRAINKQPLIIYEDGLQTRDYVHIDDVIDANMCVLENEAADFQAFNVGAGSATSVLEYANLVRQSLCSRVEVIVSGEYRLGDNRHSVSSIEKLESLGWRPKRDIQTILNDFLSWVDSVGGIPSEVNNAYDHMKMAGVVLKSSMTPV